MKQSERLVITVKDVVAITGLHIRSAQRLMKKIRCFYNLESHQFVSVENFCSYTKLEEEKVRIALK